MNVYVNSLFIFTYISFSLVYIFVSLFIFSIDLFRCSWISLFLYISIYIYFSFYLWEKMAWERTFSSWRFVVVLIAIGKSWSLRPWISYTHGKLHLFHGTVVKYQLRIYKVLLLLNLYHCMICACLVFCWVRWSCQSWNISHHRMNVEVICSITVLNYQVVISLSWIFWVHMCQWCFFH